MATYNSTAINVFINGKLESSTVPCTGPPCGPIIYPVTSHTFGDCLPGQTALTIGKVENVLLQTNFPHSGTIKHARMFSRALEETEVLDLYNALAPSLNITFAFDSEYWVKASALTGTACCPSECL